VHDTIALEFDDEVFRGDFAQASCRSVLVSNIEILSALRLDEVVVALVINGNEVRLVEPPRGGRLGIVWVERGDP
jgi:hypothetical protein